MRILMAFLAGLVFGIGLIVAGMTDPGNIEGFLDLAGRWNPSLALVMGGALAVGVLAFALAGKRERSLLGAEMLLPSVARIDRRVVLGGLIFGTGWGLGGYCPGPALAALATGSVKPLIFTGAMVLGMGMFELLERRADGAAPAPD
jgi:uncharacterized membrane protein YedE/YeeE